MDYPALFEAGRFPFFREAIDEIIACKIRVAISPSFRMYHNCVSHMMDPFAAELSKKAEEFAARISDAGLLDQEQQGSSFFSLVSSGAGREDACLFTGRNSPVLTQLRANDPDGGMTVCVFDGESCSFFPDLGSCMKSEPVPAANPVSSSADYLDVAIYVNVGDTVYTETGSGITLAEKINTGAEGIVFRTGDPDSVAKIYHKGVLTPLRWLKLLRMTKVGIRAHGICWPTALLYNRNKEPVGYLMPMAEGYTLGSVFDGPDAMAERFPAWDRGSVVQAACQVFEKIVYLHLHGILIGDIQLKNIMIQNPAQVYLIDMDSVQLEDLPCPVGTEEYTPPELWDKSFPSFLRNSLHEDYSCGILAFVMLFCGQHPYNQRLGHETLRDEIALRSFPYSNSAESNASIPAGGYDKIWQYTPVHLRQMFIQAFSEGRRFETVEWYGALALYREQIAGKLLDDPQAYMLFPYSAGRASQDTEKDLSGCRRSIRDAIIHVPDMNGKTATARAERVVYNGRPIGVAFVNQEILAEIESVKSQSAGLPQREKFRESPGLRSDRRVVSAGQSFRDGSRYPTPSDTAAKGIRTQTESPKRPPARSSGKHPPSRLKSGEKMEEMPKQSKLFFFLIVILATLVVAASILYRLYM